MNRERSIELLNKAVADELAAVHQYVYFHFHLDDLGFAPLSALFKRTAITEKGGGCTIDGGQKGQNGNPG